MSGEEVNPGGRIFIVAGEKSGDQRGAELVSAMRSRRPDLAFVGIGGEQMKKAGVDIVLPAEEISVVGSVEILERFPSLVKAYLKARRIITKGPLSATILIDFPGFNLRMAGVAKRANVPVFYYVSPQVWAWHRGRVRTISRLVNRMLVILPFEEHFYREHGVEVEYVGHPLLEKMESFIRARGSAPAWQPDRPVIGLMPGSRQREVKLMLPRMLEAARNIKKEIPGARFVMLLGREMDEEIALGLIKEAALEVEIERGPDYEVMSGFDYLIGTSGTATLEAGLLSIPMVIVYRAHMITWLLSKLLVKVPDMGLPNLVAGKRIVPELRQYKVNGKRITREALKVLKDGKEYQRMWDDLGRTAGLFGEGGAARRAAEAIISKLDA